MAFYTSRVDDDGNEIERRPTARSVHTPISGNSSRWSISSRSIDNKSSVRCVNSAAYIEHNSDASDGISISLSDDSKFHLMSMCENQSDIVPPLDIHSEDNYPTPRDFTFSYRKTATKTVVKPDFAYDTWLSAKKKELSRKAMLVKQTQEAKQREQEERKRLAEEKYRKWLESKKMHNPRSREKIKPAQEDNSTIEKVSKLQINNEEAQVRIEEWARQKRLIEEQRRAAKRLEEEQRREREEKRREMSTQAWEKWFAESAKKPKPVPLNRGIFTLRGTISEIYVNPNEWKSTLEGVDNDSE